MALWSGVCRHVPRAKAMERKAAAAPARVELPPQSVPAGFDLLSTASVYSRHIGPSYARKEVDGATLIQPTLPHMCNSGGALHGGYMMSFADSALTRAAGLVTGMAPSTISFAAEFLSAGTPTAPLVTRVEVPRHGKTLAFLRGLLDLMPPYEAPTATREQVGRVHDTLYVAELEAAIPAEGYVHVDPDTAMNPHTMKAAWHAAGAAVLGAELVARGAMASAMSRSNRVMMAASVLVG